MMNHEKLLIVKLYKILRKISVLGMLIFLMSCELEQLQRDHFEALRLKEQKNIGLNIYQDSKFPERDFLLAPYGVQEIYYTPPTDDGESYLYISYSTARQDNPLYNIRFSLNFVINGSCTANRIYYIKSKDIYMLKADGKKIEAFDFGGIGSECNVTGESFIHKTLVLGRQYIRFLMPIEYFEQGTKLVIKKVYKEDKVVMENIVYRFEAYEAEEEVNSFMNPKFSIYLPRN